MPLPKTHKIDIVVHHVSEMLPAHKIPVFAFVDGALETVYRSSIDSQWFFFNKKVDETDVTWLPQWKIQWWMDIPKEPS